MPRRNPGTESATGVRVARERLAATRWAARGAEDAAEPGESADPGREPGDSAGLLELQVPAPGSPVPVRAADGVLAAGRRVGGGTSHHVDETRGYRRAEDRRWLCDFGPGQGLRLLPCWASSPWCWAAASGGRPGPAARRWWLSATPPRAAEEAPDPADGGSTAPRREMRPPRRRNIESMLPVPWPARGWFNCAGGKPAA